MTSSIIQNSLSQMSVTLLYFFAGLLILEGGVYLFSGKVLKRKSALIPMLLTPALIGMAILILYPLFYSLALAFSNMNLYHFKNPEYSLAFGLRNFSRVFTAPLLKEVRFPTLFLRTSLWSLVQIALQLTLAYLLALSLEQPIRFKSVFRGLLILPWTIPGILAINIWSLEFNYTFGSINLILKELLGEGAMIPWMSHPLWNYTAMTIVNLWLGFPFLMMIISTAMKSIPLELYEASELEGAGAIVRIFKIQIPLLKPVIAPAALLIFTGNFMGFEIPYFLNRHNLETSDFLATALFRMAFSYNQYGFSAAFSWILTICLIVISVLFFRRTNILKGVTE